MKKRILLSTFTIAAVSLFGQGLILSKEKYEKTTKWEPKKELGFSTAAFPQSISYRAYCPTIKSQGQISTCVGWAAAYSALSTQQNIQMKIKGNMQKWARAFDPHFLYGFIKDDKDLWCQKGTSIVDALYVLENYGCKPFVWEPWLNCGDANTFDKFTLAVASNYKIEKAYALEQDKLIDNVKWALNEKMPVIIGVDLTESFVSGTSLKYGVWSPTKDEAFIGGHAMCVIGYDNNNYGGAFEVMNSYGSEYGDNGFIWIKYTDFKLRVSEAYVMDIQSLSTNPCSFGDCENTFSRYSYSTGEIYEGVFTNGKPDVWGSFIFQDGSTYIGAWKDGRKHGWGLLYDTETQKFYDTFYQNDVLTEYSAKGFALSEAEKKSQVQVAEMKKSISISTEKVDDFEKLQKTLSKFEAPDKPLTITPEKKATQPKKKSKYKDSKGNR